MYPAGVVTQDAEKVEVLDDVATVFTSKSVLQKPQVQTSKRKVWSKDDVPLVEEDQVREYLRKLHIRLWTLMGLTQKHLGS